MKRLVDATKEEFRTWLSKRGPTETVGIAVQASYCPLSVFLFEVKYPDQSVQCCPTSILINEESYEPQAWMSLFIRALDAASDINDAIPASKALSILDSIP